MNQPWSSLAVPPDAIIGVLNAVFQRWPDPGMMGEHHEGHHAGQPDTIYRCAASRNKYGRPRQSHVEAQCMKRAPKHSSRGLGPEIAENFDAEMSLRTARRRL